MSEATTVVGKKTTKRSKKMNERSPQNGNEPTKVVKLATARKMINQRPSGPFCAELSISDD
jgi:hypothetical protein